MGNIGSGRISGSSGGSSSGGSTATGLQQFNTDKDTNTFVVTSFTVSATNCKVYVDGILLPTENYIVIGNTIGTAFFVPDGSIVTITN